MMVFPMSLSSLSTMRQFQAAIAPADVLQVGPLAWQEHSIQCCNGPSPSCCEQCAIVCASECSNGHFLIFMLISLYLSKMCLSPCPALSCSVFLTKRCPSKPVKLSGAFVYSFLNLVSRKANDCLAYLRLLPIIKRVELIPCVGIAVV